MLSLQTVEYIETEMSAEEVQSVLEKENIIPLKIETQEDAVKAASAEVIEAMTIGVAQEAGEQEQYLTFLSVSLSSFAVIS